MAIGEREGRQFVVQRSLMGGLLPNSDILKARDSATWLDCQNMIVSNPTGYLSGISPKDSVTTPPPTFNMTSNSYITTPTNIVYNAPIFTQTIATFESAMWPSESWMFSGTGTASLVASISEGNESLSCACTAGQTAVGTGTVTEINLSTAKYSFLAIDSSWNNITNFSSGFIRIGSDNSNYYVFNLSAPSATGLNILKFNWASPSSTTGTPNKAHIKYVQVSLTASGGGAITVIFDNLRLASFASTNNATLTLTPNAGNIYSTYIYDTDISSSATVGSAMISTCGDSLFTTQTQVGGTYQGISMKSGFNNISYNGSITQITTSLSFPFYFSQFQKSGSPAKNILYYVNGSNGYFSYDQNASAGSRNARIQSTPYRYLCSHKNMMFLAGDTGNPNNVQPSDINDPTTLTSANSVLLPDVSGSYVTGLISMDEYLAILRNDGIWKLYGSNPDSATTDFTLIRSQSKTGCLEMRCACRVGGYIYYFDGSDVYRFNGNASENISSGMDTKLVSYNFRMCSMWYNPLRDLVIFNFVPSTVSEPVSTKNTYYQLTFCPSKNSWGEMGSFDDPVSVQFSGQYWGGAIFSRPLNFQSGLSFYQINPTTPTDISMPWFLKTQWNDANRPDIIKDHEQFTWYFRDEASRNTPAVEVDMYSDFDPDDIAQTFSSQNDIQTIASIVAADAGTWTITFDAQTTGTLNWNDSAATIQAALEALGNIGSGNISVSGTLATTVTLTFQGTLAATNVDQVTIPANTLTNSGIAITLKVNTSQDGNSYTPTNNSMQLLTNGVSGRSVSSKISGTCTSQKDKAVMVSGYSYIWSEIEDV